MARTYRDTVTTANLRGLIPSHTLHPEQLKVAAVIGVVEFGMGQFVQNPVAQIVQRLIGVVGDGIGSGRPVLRRTLLESNVPKIATDLGNETLNCLGSFYHFML